jgi:hypothetical protein
LVQSHPHGRKNSRLISSLIPVSFTQGLKTMAKTYSEEVAAYKGLLADGVIDGVEFSKLVKEAQARHALAASQPSKQTAPAPTTTTEPAAATNAAAAAAPAPAPKPRPKTVHTVADLAEDGQLSDDAPKGQVKGWANQTMPLPVDENGLTITRKIETISFVVQEAGESVEVDFVTKKGEKKTKKEWHGENRPSGWCSLTVSQWRKIPLTPTELGQLVAWFQRKDIDGEYIASKMLKELYATAQTQTRKL